MMQEEIKTIGLKWPVSFQTDSKINTPKCMSNKKSGHCIWIDPDTIADMGNRKHLLQHELGHLLLAEQVSICFSNLVFTNQAKFEKHGQQIWACWAPIDLWVDQIAYTFWPKSQIAGLEQATEELQIISRYRPSDIDKNPGFQITSALLLAERKIFHADIDMRKNNRGIAPATHSRIKAIAKKMEEMAQIRPTVKNLKTVMEEMAKIWQFEVEIEFNKFGELI